MSDSHDLADRIDAQFAAHTEWLEELRTKATADYQGRRERLQAFEADCNRLRTTWLPRLDLLAERFGKHVKVTPAITPGRREGTFAFDSKLARINLRFTASTDAEVRKLVLTYDLRIIPILMQFKNHDEIDFPIDDVNDVAVGQWIDNRIIDFVRTYLSLHQNEHYLKEHMVEDPVSGTRFPRDAAAAKIERAGQAYYFISDDTREEFEQQSP